MPICKPSGEEGRALGSGAYAGKNEGVPVAEAEIGQKILVRLVDGCQSPAAYEVQCSAPR
jgi:hypothetical protein